jgi:hypothetical protein
MTAMGGDDDIDERRGADAPMGISKRKRRRQGGVAAISRRRCKMRAMRQPSKPLRADGGLSSQPPTRPMVSISRPPSSHKDVSMKHHDFNKERQPRLQAAAQSVGTLIEIPDD